MTTINTFYITILSLTFLHLYFIIYGHTEQQRNIKICIPSYMKTSFFIRCSSVDKTTTNRKRPWYKGFFSKKRKRAITSPKDTMISSFSYNNKMINNNDNNKKMEMIR